MNNADLIKNYRAQYELHKQRLDDYFAKHPKARKSGQIKILLRKLCKPGMSVRAIRQIKKDNAYLGVDGFNHSSFDSDVVATSQPETVEEQEEEIRLFTSGEFENDEFLSAMFDNIRARLEYLSLDFCDFERSGKSMTFRDMLSDDTYKILFMVSKKKE